MPVVNIHENNRITRIAAATMSPYARVKLDSNGQLALAGIADPAVGYLTERGATSGEPAPYVAVTAPECGAIAGEAFAVGAVLYAAASGKVADTASTIKVGVAGTAASTDGDLCLVIKAEQVDLDVS